MKFEKMPNFINAEKKESLKKKREEFLSKKGIYFGSIAVRMHKALKMHKKYGLWEKTGKEREWFNVTEHCLTETARSLTLAKKLGLKRDTRRDIMKASTLHDFYKRKEIEEIKSKKGSGENMLEIAKDISERANREVRKMKFNKRVIKLFNSVSWESLKDIEKILQKDKLQDEDVASLIVHYSDDISIGSKWIEPVQVLENGEVITQLDRRMGGNENKPEWKEAQEEGRKIFNDRTIPQAQLEIGRQVEQRLTGLLSERTDLNIEPQDLPEFIDGTIKSNIDKI